MSGAITLVVSTFTALLSGIGTAFVDLFNTLVLGEGGALTTFASWIFLFIGMSIGIYVLRAILRRV